MPCHLSSPEVTPRLKRSTLHRSRMTSGEQPSDDGIRELAASGRHSTDVTTGLVSSYLTFSPLPSASSPVLLMDCRQATVGGSFLLPLQALADFYPLGSGVPCVARTFLLRLKRRRQTVPLLSKGKGRAKCQNEQEKECKNAMLSA